MKYAPGQSLVRPPNLAGPSVPSQNAALYTSRPSTGGGRTTGRDVGELESLLGYKFNDVALLREALSHRSSVKRSGLSTSSFPQRSNERLEFLGDSVLGAQVATILFDCDGHLTEGEMTRVKSMLVRNETLAEKAREMFNLDEFIVVNSRERKANILVLEGTLSDAMEAIIGAIAIDGTPADVTAFIHRMFAVEFRSDLRIFAGMDPKSELAKVAKRNNMGDLRYTVTVTRNESNHYFTAVVFTQIRGRKRSLGRGEGPSRRRAEAAAAANALVPFSSKLNPASSLPAAVVSLVEAELVSPGWLTTVKRFFVKKMQQG